MSYAIETKKRKFDRILEALSDAAAASPSRPSLNSRNNATATDSSLSLSLDDHSDASKRRRVTPASRTTLSTRTSATSLSTHYLPSSRAAFLERLETFRQVTQWHVPSTDPINAAAWAKRGWICVDTDTVFCGSCKERVHVDLTIDTSLLRPTRGEDVADENVQDDQDDDFALVTEVYANIIKKYQDMITTSHSEGCLWRKRGSDSSVQRIEGLLNTSIALASLKKRYDSIMTREEELPTVAPLTLPSPQDESALANHLFEEEQKVNLNAFRLAVTGWDRKSEDIIECHHCFRSLGLWLYRGDSPAMENLDAIDNHLDYCPWKSADAQDTEVILPSKRDANDDAAAKKERVPGWILVYSAIVKGSNKKQAKDSTTIPMGEETEGVPEVGESLTPEQREKKTRDLFKRIKEIRKPFNVKALLNRKRARQGPIAHG